MTSSPDESPKLASNRPLSPSPTPHRYRDNDVLSLQRELGDKERELKLALQASLELVQANTELRQQFDEQNASIRELDAMVGDYEMKLDLVQSENQEYQQGLSQMNDRFEEAIGELAVTREHLNNSKSEIEEYQRTMQSLSHDIVNQNSQNTAPASSSSRSAAAVGASEQHRLQKQQARYDELLREYEKLRNEREQLLECQVELNDAKQETVKCAKRNKLLSDQIVELTYANVQLEKEMQECDAEIEQQRQLVIELQTENQTLAESTAAAAAAAVVVDVDEEQQPHRAPKKRLYSTQLQSSSVVEFAHINSSKDDSGAESETMDLKRRLSVQLRDNFGYNEKFVMFANAIHENVDDDGGDGDDHEDDEQEQVLMVVENCENNDEYLTQIEHEESLSDLSTKTPHKNVEQEQKEMEEEATTTMVIANKSREEKTIVGASTATTKSSPASQSSRRPLHINNKARRRRRQPGGTPPTVVRARTYKQNSGHKRSDALDEYLHLTASAVKINYPTVNATSKDLIELVRVLPFYQAHDHLNRHMMHRLRWQQIQQNKLLQLKAAAIAAQRDHEIAQKSTVTRLFKKWFTTEYDDVDHIVNGGGGGGGTRNHNKLSAPLSANENLRIHRVGKAQMRRTKSGGASVNLGTLNPSGIPPKGTHQQRRVSSSGAGRGVQSLMAITQTLPSSMMKDRKVQKMLAINAHYIGQVVQQEQEQEEQEEDVRVMKEQKPVPVQPQPQTQPMTLRQKGSLVSWLFGTQSTQSQSQPQKQQAQVATVDKNENVNEERVRRPSMSKLNKPQKSKKIKESVDEQDDGKQQESGDDDAAENIANALQLQQESAGVADVADDGKDNENHEDDDDEEDVIDSQLNEEHATADVIEPIH